MKPDLKIWFTAFWGTFDKFDNLFVYSLSQKYNVQVTPDNPEIRIDTMSLSEEEAADLIIDYLNNS